MRPAIRRGLVAAVAITALALPATAGGATPNPTSGGTGATAQPRPQPIDWAALGIQQVPKHTPSAAVLDGDAAPAGVNPYTSWGQDPATVDWAYWQAVAQARGQERAAAQVQATATPPLVHTEVEPAGTRGQNDTQATAEFVNGFGTGGRRTPAAQLLGTLAPSALVVQPVASAEDDGAIPLANATGLDGGPGQAATDATVGDGPHGSAGSGSGDFDFYKVTATAGQLLVADIDTPTSNLDSVLVLWDSAGSIVDFSDDFDGFDSLISVQIPADGDYFVMVAGFFSLPDDPFDSGSGIGAESEGGYHLAIDIDTAEADVYSFDVKAGDVIGATVTGAAGQLVLFDPTGRQLMGSTQDLSFIYPAQSPLPGGGNATVDHVAGTAGRYALMVTRGTGAYEVTLEAHRPEEHQGRNEVQTLFLDFDGARVNTNVFGGPGTVQLSPLSSFLAGWGLTPADEDAVIDAIVATVEENVRADLAQRGGNPRFAVRVRNSRDNADTFGQPNTSRLDRRGDHRRVRHRHHRHRPVHRPRQLRPRGDGADPPGRAEQPGRPVRQPVAEHLPDPGERPHRRSSGRRWATSSPTRRATSSAASTSTSSTPRPT